MLLCKSRKLYFRTTIGLFQVSSIDYAAKVLIILHPFSSPSQHFISPSLLSAGFPSSAPQPNSLVLINCTSNEGNPKFPFVRNCSQFCGNDGASFELEGGGLSPCLLVVDARKLHADFSPSDVNCSHYRRVYRESSDADDEEEERYVLGTRISFEIPDHVPNLCEECVKPHGNCGVGLRSPSGGLTQHDLAHL
ncbi:hypothetical protein Ancab_011216 [Ancistrocladus abbreviatus]